MNLIYLPEVGTFNLSKCFNKNTPPVFKKDFCQYNHIILYGFYIQFVYTYVKYVYFLIFHCHKSIYLSVLVRDNLRSMYVKYDNKTSWVVRDYTFDRGA